MVGGFAEVGASVLRPIGENDPTPTGWGSALRSTEGTLFIGAIGLDLPPMAAGLVGYGECMAAGFD